MVTVAVKRTEKKDVKPMADKEKIPGGSPAEMSAEEVLQKFDKESDKREMDGLWGHCLLYTSPSPRD